MAHLTPVQLAGVGQLGPLGSYPVSPSCQTMYTATDEKKERLSGGVEMVRGRHQDKLVYDRVVNGINDAG